MSFLRYFLLAGAASVAIAEEPRKSPEPVENVAAVDAEFPSPDGRFFFKHSPEDSDEMFVHICERKGGKVVADLSEQVMLSAIETAKLIWSPDSNSFAANFQAGGRYETTLIFRWNGTEFAELEFPEAALYEKVVEPARQRELKLANKAPDTYLRRIWDKWKTTKWTSNDTIEIEGESTAAFYENEEARDIAIGVQATIKFDEAGKPAIVRSVEVAASE